MTHDGGEYVRDEGRPWSGGSLDPRKASHSARLKRPTCLLSLRSLHRPSFLDSQESVVSLYDSTERRSTFQG